MSAVLNIKDLHKSFRQQQVLKGINLSLNAGEALGLVGINGAGKTTLIKSVLDFCDINAGEITLFGLSHRQTSSRQKLAFLPERFLPPYYLTGEMFLRYFVELQGAQYSREQAIELAESFGMLEEVLDKSTSQLSKGMAQKLGLMATLMADKELLILDEPMSGLDPRARALFKRQLKTMKERGKTLFFSTHLLADVDAICDRMAILDDGVLSFIGTPEECRQQFDAEDLEDAYLRCIET